MLEYNIKKSLWGWLESDYGDHNTKESYQLEFADVIYYALKSKGASFKMIFDDIEDFPQKGQGFIKIKWVPKTCEDLITEAKKRQKEAKRNGNYDGHKGLYKIPEYNIDILSDFTYRDNTAYSLQKSSEIFIPMIEAWKKYFNVLANINSCGLHRSCLEILVNENESDRIYKKSQKIREFKNEFYSYCLNNRRDLLDKFAQELKDAEHIAINKYGIYRRCGKHGLSLQDIQKGRWNEKTFSSYKQKNLESDAQVVGLSLALMKLLEKDFDILHYFDNGTFLMWISKKEEPVVIQKISKVEPVKLNEW